MQTSPRQPLQGSDYGDQARNLSKDFIVASGRFPQNSLRKPRIKKDATNLRGKGSQYREIADALDLMIDGPTLHDKKFLQELSLHNVAAP